MNVLSISKNGKELSDISRATTRQNQNIQQPRSFLADFSSSWVSPLLLRGARGNLCADDLYSLKQKHRSVNLLRHFTIPQEKVHIGRHLSWNFKGTLFTGVFTKLLFTILKFLNIFLLKELIDSSVESSPLTRSLTLTILIFVILEVMSFLNSIYRYTMNRDSSLALSITINQIARKSFRLANRHSSQWKRRNIESLITEDSEIVVGSPEQFHNLWSSLVELLLSFGFLYFLLGIPVLAFPVLLALYFILNIFLTRIIASIKRNRKQHAHERSCLLAETVSNVKVVKTHAWEEAFEHEILKLRREEIHLLSRESLLQKLLDSVNSTAPFVMLVVSFAWLSLWQPSLDLTPQIAFISLLICNILRQPMLNFFPAISYLNKASHSCHRINTFLNTEEMDHHRKKEDSSVDEISILLRNATFSWDKEISHLKQVRTFKLAIRNALNMVIDLHIETGAFHIFTGDHESGKSCMLSAILGEMYLVDGDRLLNGSIGFVPQNAWIFNGTVRANILYGNDYEKNKYDKIVRACDLKTDLYNLPRYDATIIGENGYSLTSDQKCRIALARALYQDCDVYLIDDIFNGLGGKTVTQMNNLLFGSHGLLSKKTVVLVSSNMTVARNSDQIHVMEDGRIIESGSFEELTEKNEFIMKLKKESEDREKRISEETKKKKKQKKAVMFEPNQIRDEASKNETLESKKKPSSLYLQYLGSFSYIWGFLVVVSMIGRFALETIIAVWLYYWIEYDGKIFEAIQIHLQIFIVLSLGIVFADIFSVFFCSLGSISASNRLFTPVVFNILRAPLKAFERMKTKLMMKELTENIAIVDNRLAKSFHQMIQSILKILMIFVTISIFIPWFAIVFIPYFLFFSFFVGRFIPPYQQIQRISTTQKASMLANLHQNINGCSTIRAFGRVKMSLLTFHEDVDSFIRCRYITSSIVKWIQLRMELLANVSIFICVLLSVIFHYIGMTSATEVALCVSFSFLLTEFSTSAIKFINQMQGNIGSIAGIQEYRNMQTEASWVSDFPLIDSWPHSGCIETMKLNVYKDKDLPLLKEISLTIKGGETILVLGDKNSEKTSLISALLRFIEGRDGDIKIDGVNIGEIGLHQLRSRITVIPEDCSIFSSTLRFNLDPFKQFSDSDLWLALEGVELKDEMAAKNIGLDTIVDKSKLCISDRHRISLCRALLKGGKVVIVDDTNTEKDDATSHFISEAVSNHFKYSTVIHISDRIYNMDAYDKYDRVYILEDGEISEVGEPVALMKNENSLFREFITKQC